MSDQRPTGERRPTRAPRDEDVDRPRRTVDRERQPADGERTARSGDRGNEQPRARDGVEPRRHSDQARGEQRRPRDGEDHARRPLDAIAASRIALDALQTMTRRTAEGVVGVEREDDGGWLVVVELLETSRVPATADVLGEYEVEIGPDRALRSYTRRSRYTRASTMSD